MRLFLHLECNSSSEKTLSRASNPFIPSPPSPLSLSLCAPNMTSDNTIWSCSTGLRCVCVRACRVLLLPNTQQPISLMTTHTHTFPTSVKSAALLEWKHTHTWLTLVHVRTPQCTCAVLNLANLSLDKYDEEAICEFVYISHTKAQILEVGNIHFRATNEADLCSE